MITKSTTIKLAAGPEITDATDAHLLVDRARIEYDPAVGTLTIDAGADNILTQHGGNMRVQGTITAECGLRLLALLTAWLNGTYE